MIYQWMDSLNDPKWLQWKDESSSEFRLKIGRAIPDEGTEEEWQNPGCSTEHHWALRDLLESATETQKQNKSPDLTLSLTLIPTLTRTNDLPMNGFL